MAMYSDILDGTPPARRRWWHFFRRHIPGFSILLMVAFLAAIILFPYVVITVPSGMVGVLWKRFNGYDLYCWCFVGRGTILDPQELRDEGLHVIWPWDKLYQYNLRLQSSTKTYNAITKDGVNVIAQINIRFQLLHNTVAVLHKFIGPDYLETVVDPEIGSRAREVISQYTAQEVYTSREQIQEKIQKDAQKSLGTHLDTLVQPEAMEQPDPKHYNDFLQDSIQILDSLVLSIELPPAIVGAINRQTQQYYEIQEFKYRVEREAQESRRKQIEANGIAAFQKTVSQGISDSYLRWRGIEATLALAQSQNTKIVIIGSGKDGLPIILGNVDGPPAAPGPGPAARPSDEAPPGDKTSSASPGGSNTPGASPGGPDQKASEGGATPDNKSAAQEGKPIPGLDLSKVKALLPWLTEQLRSTESATNSGSSAPGASPPPKQ
jgi:regulator of protease activity HflC (stomatin/prohibitin superfamily)